MTLDSNILIFLHLYNLSVNWLVTGPTCLMVLIVYKWLVLLTAFILFMSTTYVLLLGVYLP